MGKIKYETEGNVSFLISLLTVNGIKVYDPVQINSKCNFKIKEKQARKAEQTMLSVGKNFSVLNNQSIVDFANRMKKRIGIIAGIVLAILLLSVWSVNVTKIKISGNKLISDDAIKEKILSDYSLPLSKSKINIKDLEKKLISVDGIGNASVEIKGNTIFINVLEEFPTPDVVDFNDKSDLISKFDGIVTELVVFSGEAKVKVGDTVKKGDVLISHIKTLSNGTTIESKALGTVKGRYWITKNAIITPKKTVYERTGNEKTIFTAKGFSKQINPPFENYEYSRTEFFFRSLFPLKIAKHTYYETVKTEVNVDYEKEKKAVSDRLIGELEKELPPTCEKMKSWISEKTVDKNVILVIYYEIVDSLV